MNNFPRNTAIENKGTIKLTQQPADPQQLAQRIILSIQALEDEIARGQSNMQMIQVQSQRLIETTAAVQELKHHKPGDEVMINIGSGVHLHVKLTNTKNVVNVIGTGLAAEQTIDEALASFEEKQKQLTDIASRQQEQIQTAQNRLEELRTQLNQLMQAQQQEQQTKS